MSQGVTVALGITDAQVKVGEHVAYFWENEQEFTRGVEVLMAGLNAADHAPYSPTSL